MAHNRDGRQFILLVILLMVFQIYPGPKVTIAEEVAEHTYIIFEDDFEDGEAEDWSLSIPPMFLQEVAGLWNWMMATMC